MSNPRKFGNVTLYRVTRAMPLDKAKRKAATIRKSGIQARVDSYQGRYAVWSTKSADKDYSARLKQRERLGHICGTCEHFAANTKFKKWGGKNIIPNQCMQGRRRTTDPPFIVSPDSPCILSFDLWKRAQKAKMITIYHGTTSKALPKIKRSGKVIGQWTNDPRFASQFAIMEESESPTSDKSHAIILVAEVPENIISHHWDDYEIICGFNLKGGQVLLDKSLSYTGELKSSIKTAQLSVSYISYVFHIKRLSASYMREFNRSDWVKRKL